MSSDRDALRSYLAEQAELVHTAGDAVVTGAHESVHDVRVAIRRVRSTLRTFGPLLPPDGTLELDLRLKQAAAALGLVRDLEVFDELLGSQPPGPVRDREQGTARAALARRRDVVRAELAMPGHVRLVADLALYVAALDDTDGELRPLARRAAKKARKRLAGVGEDATALHRVRVAAKRARYAAEVVGKDKRARRLKGITDGLGVHHDCHAAAAELRSLEVDGAEAAERDRIVADLDRRAEEGRLAAMSSL